LVVEENMKRKSKNQLMTVAAYAARRGVTTEAVRKALAVDKRIAGALVVVNGKRLLDPEMADRLWLANTRLKVDPVVSEAFATARAQRMAAEASLLERKLAELESELVPAADLGPAWARITATCKARLLRIPADWQRRCPGVTAQQVDVVERLVREAIEPLDEDAPYVRKDSR
jgi:phage terminase Nu1 subunit (DNA packaging protein)